MKAELDFNQCMKAAFDLWKQHVPILIAVYGIAALLSACTMGVLAGPLWLGCCHVTLGLADRRSPTPTVNDLFTGFQYFLPAFLLGLGVSILTTLASLVTWPLGMITMLVCLTALMFAPFLIVAEGADLSSAVRASYEAAKANFWPLFGLVVIGAMVAASGILIMSFIVTLPYFGCLMTVIYRQANPAAGQRAPAAPQEPEVVFRRF